MQFGVPLNFNCHVGGARDVFSFLRFDASFTGKTSGLFSHELMEYKD